MNNGFGLSRRGLEAGKRYRTGRPTSAGGAGAREGKEIALGTWQRPLGTTFRQCHTRQPLRELEPNN